MSEVARRVLAVTGQSILDTSATLPSGFEDAVALILATRGRLIFSGLGKSGIICRKLAATFASTGTPAYFVHSADALHGDLGMIDAYDTVVGISHSGRTEELLSLLERTKRHGAALIALTGCPDSPIAEHADVAVCYEISDEGGPLGLAPMASTSVALAVGDALAAEVMHRKQFSAAQFARVHPGGGLGRQLTTIGDILKLHARRGIPSVPSDSPLLECLGEMSEKRLGMTTVRDADGRVGVLSDGDVRRCLEERQSDAFATTAGALCTWEPRWIESTHVATEALAIMEAQKITALLVRDENGALSGVIHLHDLWGLQMI
ncbi:MAG: KpsF/GutQ family sugar-phosphate isomerase [Pseudomonadota bacterium]